MVVQRKQEVAEGDEFPVLTNLAHPSEAANAEFSLLNPRFDIFTMTRVSVSRYVEEMYTLNRRTSL